MNIIWKDVVGYEGYYLVNNIGEVKTLYRNKILKPYLSLGYPYVTLTKNKTHIKKKIHRLVAEAFINNTEKKKSINHINAVRHDNRVENLEWATHSENMKHKFKLGNQSNKRGFNAMAKIVINLQNGIFYDCAEDAAESIGMNGHAFRSMLNGKAKNKTYFTYA